MWIAMLDGDVFYKSHRLDRVLHAVYKTMDKDATRWDFRNQILILGFARGELKKLNYYLQKVDF